MQSHPGNYTTGCEYTGVGRTAALVLAVAVTVGISVLLVIGVLVIFIVLVHTSAARNAAHSKTAA